VRRKGCCGGGVLRNGRFLKTVLTRGEIVNWRKGKNQEQRRTGKKGWYEKGEGAVERRKKVNDCQGRQPKRAGQQMSRDS